MYLPNPDVRPTGYEACEFLDLSTLTPPAEATPAPFATDLDDDDLDDHARDGDGGSSST